MGSKNEGVMFVVVPHNHTFTQVTSSFNSIIKIDNTSNIFYFLWLQQMIERPLHL